MSRPGLSLSVQPEDEDEVVVTSQPKFGGLKLSVEDDSAELDQSFKISNQGTFIAGNFKINKDGMKGGSLAAAAAVAHAKSLAPSSALSSSSSSSSSSASFSSSGVVGASPIKPGGASSKAAAQAFGPDELVILRQLGRGASGIVYLALHLPTLTLVAQKTLNVFQQDVRHQFMKELTAYAHSFSSEPQSAGAAGLGSSVTAGHSMIGGHGSSMAASSSIGGDHSLEASVASINERSAIALASLAAPPPPPSAAGFGVGPESGSKALIHFIGASYLDGKLSIFIEYMDSGSLQDLVDARGPMSEAVLRSVMRQSVAGLQTLHQRRQVHRDIKAANILVNHRGEVKIADFGILAILDDADALCKTFVGTTLYMSPERIRGEKYGAPGDIWSIGMTAIVCANGAFPFDATGGYFGIVQKVMNEPSPALSEAAGFSAACVDWVSKCLIKDPAQRWTAEQLLAHPWMTASSSASASSSAGAIDPKQWPPTFSAERVATNERDLTAVVRAIAEHYYCRAGSPAYRGSLFEMARFERVAEQFGVATAKVKKLFEAQLKELKELAVAAASTAMGALAVGK